MAAFLMPGGVELWIIVIVLVIILGPVFLIALVIWLLVGRKSRIAPPAVPAGWLTDPTGRHELRFWDGAGWSSNVSDGGVQGRDQV